MCNCMQLRKAATDIKGVLQVSDSNHFLGLFGSLEAAISPNEEQINIAKKRSNTCSNCPYIANFGENNTIQKIKTFMDENFPSEEVKQMPANYSICRSCGHLLFVKVFVKSDSPNISCPHGFWNFEQDLIETQPENAQKIEDISALNLQTTQEPPSGLEL